MIATYISLGCYFLALIFIGYWSSRKETAEDYLISSRNLAGWQTGISLTISWTNGLVLSSVAILAFNNIIDLVFITVGGIGIGLGLLAYLAPRIRDTAEKYNAFTLPGLVQKIYKKRTGVLVAFICGVIYTGVAMADFIVGGAIISQLINQPYEVGVIIMGLIAGIYIYLGGFNSLVYTDILQFSLLVFLAGVFLLFGQVSDQAIPDMIGRLDQFKEVGLMAGAVGFIFPIAAQLLAPDAWQRVYAARNGSAARWGMVYSLLLWTVIAAGIAILSTSVLLDNPNYSDIETISAIFNDLIPAWVTPISFVVLVAILMSSMDTFMFVVSQSIITDGFAQIFNWRIDEPAKTTRWGLFLTIPLIIGLSVVYQNILGLLYMMFYLFACMMPALWLVLKKTPPREAGVFWAILGSLVLNIILFISDHLTQEINVIIMMVSMAMPIIYDQIADRFNEKVDQPI